MLYKLHDNEELKEEIRMNLPIEEVLPMMKMFIPNNLNVSLYNQK